MPDRKPEPPPETLREHSVDWIRRSLATELRDDSPMMRTRAENLEAIMTTYDVPIEELIQWIHTDAPNKSWSAAEFRRYCEVRHERAIAAAVAESLLPPNWPH